MTKQIDELMDLVANNFQATEYNSHSTLRTALEAALKPGEPVCYQYQSRDGEWFNFVNDKHYADTVADGSWPIRALYVAPQHKHQHRCHG